MEDFSLRRAAQQLRELDEQIGQVFAFTEVIVLDAEQLLVNLTDVKGRLEAVRENLDALHTGGVQIAGVKAALARVNVAIEQAAKTSSSAGLTTTLTTQLIGRVGETRGAIQDARE